MRFGEDQIEARVLNLLSASIRFGEDKIEVRVLNLLPVREINLFCACTQSALCV